MSVKDLAAENYDGRVLNVLKQKDQPGTVWSCIGTPKNCHLLLYCHGMRAEYRDKAGKCYLAGSGDVVLTAEGSEYTVSFFPEEGEAESIGINFHLMRENEPLGIRESITVFSGGPQIYSRLFARAEETFLRTPSPVLQKAVLFRILGTLGETGEGIKNNDMSLISPGVRYIREHFTENFSLSRPAALCHISEVYFRRLFILQMAMSPGAYRIQLRMERAKGYLAYTDLPIARIAELLGYSEASFFIHQFKEHVGKTPLTYRKLHFI